MKKYVNLILCITGICMAPDIPGIFIPLPDIPVLSSSGKDWGNVQFINGETDLSSVSHEAQVPDQFGFDPDQNTIIEQPFNYNPDRPWRQIESFRGTSGSSNQVEYAFASGMLAKIRCWSPAFFEKNFTNRIFSKKILVNTQMRFPRQDDSVLLQLVLFLKTGSSIDDLDYILHRIKSEWMEILESNPTNKVELTELQGIIPEYLNKKFSQNWGTDSNRPGQIISLIQAYRNSDPGIDWLNQQVKEYRFSHNSLAEILMDEEDDLDFDVADSDNKIELAIKIAPKFPTSLVRAAEESRKHQIKSQLRSLGIQL